MCKVVHLTSAHPVCDVRILVKECATLARAGYEVVLVAAGAGDGEQEGVRIVGIPKPDGRWKRMTVTAYTVVRAAKAENADIYHLHDPELLPWVQPLRLRGKRIIFDMHENMPLAISTKPWLNPQIRRVVKAVFTRVEKLLLRGVAVVFAEESYQKHYPELEPQAVVLNMPMVDELLTIPRNKSDHFTVGYMGRVAQQRGSMVMLQALSILQEQGVSVEFDCVGPTERQHRQALSSFAHSLHLRGIRFHGYKLPREGWEILARCHAGLAVLQDVPNYRESYPTKLFEYMALGLPVVASDFPLYRRIVEEHACGICVDPADARAVAGAIHWLYQHPGEAEAMGRRGRKAVCEKYNWQVEGVKLLEFYRQVLAN